MRIGVIGASGFIGWHLVRRLQAGGHAVSVIGRSRAGLMALHPGLDARALPQTREDAGWPRVVVGLDAIVCAAGTIEPSEMAFVHEELPAILARHARDAGIGRFVLITAIGAAPDAPTAFLRGKAVGEKAVLEDRQPGWTVVRPSLVYGPGGTSMALFAALAALPLRPRFGGGSVRPIAIDDLVEAIVRCVETGQPLPPIIEAVGPDPVTSDGYIDALGTWLGTKPMASLRVPDALLAVLTRFGAIIGMPLIRTDLVAMLRKGSDGDPEQLPATLGLRPAPLAEGLRRHPATDGERFAAKWWLLGLLLRLSLSLLWIGTGVVSLWSYNVGLDLLAQGGIAGMPAHVLLIAGAVWDLVLGFAMLANWRIRLVAMFQILTIIAFTILATVMVPQFWAHPFGPLLKNIPLLFATVAVGFLGRKYAGHAWHPHC